MDRIDRITERLLSDRRDPSRISAGPPEGYTVVLCPHCGAKNGIPSNLSENQKVRCNKCKQSFSKSDQFWQKDRFWEEQKGSSQKKVEKKRDPMFDPQFDQPSRGLPSKTPETKVKSRSTNGCGLLTWPNGQQMGYLGKVDIFSRGNYGHYYDTKLGKVHGETYVDPKKVEDHNKCLLEQQFDEFDQIGVGERYKLYLSRAVGAEPGTWEDRWEVQITGQIPRRDRDSTMLSHDCDVEIHNYREQSRVITVFVITFVRDNKTFRTMIKPEFTHGDVTFERIS